LAADDFPPGAGGIQRYSSSLAAALDSLGHRVTVLTSSRAKGIEPSFPYTVLKAPLSRKWGIRLPVYLLEVVRITRVLGITRAIATNWYPLGLLLAVASRIVPDLRFVIVCHGLEVLSWTGLFRVLMFWSLRSSDRVIAVSRFTKGTLLAQGVPPDRVKVVNPGVGQGYLAGSRAPPGDALSLLTVARLVERKGLDTAINSLSRLPDGIEFRYVIVGSGPDRGRLTRLADSLDMNHVVHFAGKVPDLDLMRLYRSADIFILPTDTGGKGNRVEGFGIVLLEAQASGTPVIAARSGGIPEALIDGRTGVLVPPRGQERIAGLVVELASDRSMLQRMGRRGRIWARGFTWRKAAEEISSSLR